MFIKFATATLLSLFATLACCDEPFSGKRRMLLPAVVPLEMQHVESLPLPPASVTHFNEENEISGGRVETRLVDGKHIIMLSERSQIKHSSQANGTFTVSADVMRFAIRSQAMNNPDSLSLSDLEATGSCTFVCNSIRISANRFMMKTDPKIGRSTVSFDGNVVISTNGLTASADSVSLARIGTSWSLSGLLTAPQIGD